MSALAVLGTDTGVGKTVVTAAVVARCRRAGVDARAVKPVQTGADDDAGVVADLCEAAAATCLRYLDPPLAPAVAADEMDETLSYAGIREACAAELESGPAVLEGVGGLRVPLADGREVVDLVADLGLPALVVARADLGTLNHTALTVEALDRRGIEVRGVLLNGYTGETVAERTNPETLGEMVDPPVGTLPRVERETEAATAGALVDRLPPWALPEGTG